MNCQLAGFTSRMYSLAANFSEADKKIMNKMAVTFVFIFVVTLNN